MKLNYKNQMILSLAIVLVACILGSILKHWLFRSAAYWLCGLLWIIHPVFPGGAEVTKRTLGWMRLAGVVLILIGVFSRG